MDNSATYGLDIKSGSGMTRINLGCAHQRGMIYVVPADKSWVCSPESMPGHALAGFLRELTGEMDPRIKMLMQRWGIYYRELPIEDPDPNNS